MYWTPASKGILPSHPDSMVGLSSGSKSSQQVHTQKCDQIYKKMSKIREPANGIQDSSPESGLKKGLLRSNGVQENQLHLLKQQIEQLEVNHSRQAYQRLEAEAFLLKKKRINLFRATDRNPAEQGLWGKTTASFHFNTQNLEKKSSNKNSVKIFRLLKSYLDSGVKLPIETKFLPFISQKHKFPSFQNQALEPKSQFYTEGEIRKVKKYQNKSQVVPQLGLEFDYENVNQEEENQKITDNPKDFYEEDVNCFDDIPTLTGYLLPQNHHFEDFVLRNKKQLYKSAKLMARIKMEKEGALKRMAYLCVRQVDRRYKKCLKNQCDYINRAKKIHREGLLYWRKRDKELIELKKRKEKIEADVKRKNEEKQEEETQKKKLEYLMKQSVLYSHFMAKKLGMEPENKDLGLDGENNKNNEIDDEAARLNVEQKISKKMDDLERFDGGEKKLDFSNAEVQEEEIDITGPPPIFQGKLKDYQVKGLKWLYNLNLQGINGILADEMGLGKTIQAIALLSHISFTQKKWGPFLIVSPSSTLHNWQQQFKRFCPALKILPYWGGLKQRKVIRKFFSTKKFTGKEHSHFHVVITSYQMAVQDEKTFRRLKWQFIVLDEAHNIKNTMSQRWNVLKEFQSRSRLLLTGTPIQNNMAELWALLNFIMPELFDSHEQFNEWFSKDIEAHSQDQKELDKIQIQRLHAILKPFMLRRVKKDVEHEIGKKHEHRIFCEMTKRQKNLYESIKDRLNVKELFKFVETKNKVDNLMNLVMQLRKVCNHPELFERRHPNSPFLFQEIYYYTGFAHNRSGEIKLLCFNSVNPIDFNLPRLVYDEVINFVEDPLVRNKNILNLYEPQRMRESSGLGCLNMMSLSHSQIQLCFKEDPLFSGLLLAHWLTRKNYTKTLSTDCYLNFCENERFKDERFLLDKKLDCVNALSQIMTPKVMAPTVSPKINSLSFYEKHSLVSNNKYQKFMMEGKYQKEWGHIIPGDKPHEGFLPKGESLTKIRLVDFGSLIGDSSKLAELDRILKEKKKSGDKVLIFCQMTKMLDILEDFMNLRKYSFFRLDGACSLSDRRDMVNQFQRENSKVFVFLLSTRAGGLGVTLTAANNVIFYDNDWNPTMDAQATDRAHRIGQTRDVYVYQLVTENSIEARIVKRAEQKKTVQSTVYEGGSLNIFKKDMLELMADELGIDAREQIKKEEQNMKKRGPKPVKPSIGKTKDKEKTY